MKEKTPVGDWAETLPELFATFRGDIGWRIVSVGSAVAAVIGCACAAYLCLRSSSTLAEVPWIPRPLGSWADHHGRLRNLPAFFLLMCPFLVLLPAFLWRAGAFVGVGLFGTLLEFLQHFLPGRWMEWQDVFWTWAGAMVAWAAFEAGIWLLNRRGLGLPWHKQS